MIRFQRFLFGAVLAVQCSGLFAQQAPAVPDPDTLTIPPPTCDQPATRPPLGATPRDAERFNKQVKAYLDCMQNYAKGVDATSKQYQAIASKYLEAGNKAITTYNDYITEVKKNTDSD
jgi:hypothetical protein